MKKTIKQQFWLLVLLFFSAGLSAQEKPVSFTLEEAQQYAMENSFVLQNSQLDIRVAQKQVWETISTGLPQVSGSANYNMNLNLPVSLVPAEFFGGEPGEYQAVKFGQDYNSDFGFTVSQLIFDGSYIVGIGSSKIYLNLTKEALEKSEINIRDAVAQAYYMVLVGQQNLEVMKENLVNTNDLYEETKAYFDNGFREEMDVDQMRIMVKNAENEVLKAEREIKIAKVVLKYSMGYEIVQPIELTDELDEFLSPLVERTNPESFDISNHIDYRMAVTNFQVSEKMLKLEKVKFLPKLSAFYNYSKTAYGNNANLFKSSVSWYPSSMLGFQLSVPIFNSGQKVFRMQQAEIKLEQAKTNRQLAETTLQKDFLTAVAEMESALEKYNNDAENRELAAKILDKSKIKFNNGMTSSTELSQLESQYIQTHGAYIASILQVLQADLKLNKATGEL